MSIVLFDHPCVGVPQILGDDEKGYAVHRGETCPGVSQRMKVDRGLDLGVPAGLDDRVQLMALAPGPPVGLEEHQLAPQATSAELCKEGCTLIGQDDMARLAGLADTDRDGAGIPVEVINPKTNELAITGTGFQGRPNQLSKRGVATTQQTLTLGKREIAEKQKYPVESAVHETVVANSP